MVIFKPTLSPTLDDGCVQRRENCDQMRYENCDFSQRQQQNENTKLGLFLLL